MYGKKEESIKINNNHHFYLYEYSINFCCFRSSCNLNGNGMIFSFYISIPTWILYLCINTYKFLLHDYDMFGCVFIRFIVCVCLHLCFGSKCLGFLLLFFFFLDCHQPPTLTRSPYKYGNGFKFICFLDPMATFRFKSTSLLFFGSLRDRAIRKWYGASSFVFSYFYLSFRIGTWIIQHIFSILMDPCTYWNIHM